MVPDPCAARVFDFLGIDFSSYIVLIWKGSRHSKFTALIAALGVRSTGGGFYCIKKTTGNAGGSKKL